METNKLLKLYDEDYAKVYDDRFIHTEGYKHVTDFEIELLKLFLPVSENWLDVACGTGYFLSQFQDVKRAGVDISPGMLKVAKSRNSSALFFEERDFRLENKDFDNRWDLVSSMWGAYCYVESMTEFNKFVKNISDWTSEDGVCFLPLIDLEDVLYWRETLQHCNPDIQVFGGPSYVNGVIWSYGDNLHDKMHENMIAVHIEYVIKQLQKTFSRIDTVYYPPYPPPIPGQRKGLIATGKNGNVSAEISNIFDKIHEQSEKNKAEVLSMETFENKPTPQTGWLRKTWQYSPNSFKRIVRKIIGE